MLAGDFCMPIGTNSDLYVNLSSSYMYSDVGIYLMGSDRGGTCRHVHDGR